MELVLAEGGIKTKNKRGSVVVSNEFWSLLGLHTDTESPTAHHRLLPHFIRLFIQD